MAHVEQVEHTVHVHRAPLGNGAATIAHAGTADVGVTGAGGGVARYHCLCVVATTAATAANATITATAIVIPDVYSAGGCGGSICCLAIVHFSLWTLHTSVQVLLA